MACSSRLIVVSVLLTLTWMLTGLAGCATEDIVGPQRENAKASAVEGPVEGSTAPVPLAGRTEADLVQELTLHRTKYAQCLRAMATFYSESGYEQKAAYARNELRSFSGVKQASYLSDGSVEVPPPASSTDVDLQAIKLADRNESDFVEEMIEHRRMYAETLRVLATFYAENGMDAKANLARVEMKGLQKVKQYKYILDAELPMTSLRPTESIPEADQLYKEGLKILGEGGHRVPIFYSRETMNKALAKFKEIIAKYPTSDKIDETAYFIAETYKEYGEEKDNLLAIEWYKRAIEWNPQLNLPAWSHCAHVYDFRLHEREKALEWYYKVLENEKDKTGWRFIKNIDVANKRIAELTSEKTRYAPAEPTPAPEGTPTPVAPQAPTEK